MEQQALPAQVISNTEILMFIMGFQGGTVHQLAQVLQETPSSIINADYEYMQHLMRVAQLYAIKRWKRGAEEGIEMDEKELKDWVFKWAVEANGAPLDSEINDLIWTIQRDAYHKLTNPKIKIFKQVS